jgi:hypothetical protein
VEGVCECGNEPSGFLRCGEFLDQLRSCYILKKDSAVWSKLVIYLVYRLSFSQTGFRQVNLLP